MYFENKKKRTPSIDYNFISGKQQQRKRYVFDIDEREKTQKKKRKICKRLIILNDFQLMC